MKEGYVINTGLEEMQAFPSTEVNVTCFLDSQAAILALGSAIPIDQLWSEPNILHKTYIICHVRKQTPLTIHFQE